MNSSKEDGRAMATAPRHAWFALLEPGVVQLTFPPETTDHELTDAFVALERWMFDEVDAPYAFVIRVDHVLALTSKQRRIVGEYERRYATVETRFNVGQAMVIRSSVQRGIFTAFTWLSPPVWPYRVFADVESARAWLRLHWAEVTRDYPSGPSWTGRLRERERPISASR
jgi:hypothetical protein